MQIIFLVSSQLLLTKILASPNLKSLSSYKRFQLLLNGSGTRGFVPPCFGRYTNPIAISAVRGADYAHQSGLFPVCLDSFRRVLKLRMENKNHIEHFFD